MEWNLGDILDTVAANVPGERPALVQDGHVTTWREFDLRGNRVARALIAAGLLPRDRVAIVARNAPVYIEALAACLKARLAPLNINYRYRPEEIAHVFHDSGVRAVLFQDEFAPLMAPLRARFPGVTWISADAPQHRAGDALSFQALAADGDGTPLDIARSGDDFLLLYTGGTTGMPKGVVWPAAKYRQCQLESPLVRRRPDDLAGHAALVRAVVKPGRLLPVCPLMHGTGLNSSLGELFMGGTVVLAPAGAFDADQLWRAVDRERVNKVLIVGDVFARPMLRALDAAAGGHDLACLEVISSAGLIWSREVKQGLLRHLPGLTLVDSFGASEASGLGYAITSAAQEPATGAFSAGAKTVLIADDGRVLAAGEVGVGLIARGEPLPAGYFNDPVKTATVFRHIGGVRYAVPGDYARRGMDGTIQLIGRGSQVINTGGEKVFVEEVEEALKLLPDIDDALVVGLPDQQWGSVVMALVSTRSGAPPPAGTAALLARTLAGYKIPKALFHLHQLPRSDAGKADYNGARRLAAQFQADQAAETRQ